MLLFRFNYARLHSRMLPGGLAASYSMIILWMQHRYDILEDFALDTQNALGSFYFAQLVTYIRSLMSTLAIRLVWIEAAGKLFAATASTNTGILLYTGLDHDARTLA